MAIDTVGLSGLTRYALSKALKDGPRRILPFPLIVQGERDVWTHAREVVAFVVRVFLGVVWLIHLIVAKQQLRCLCRGRERELILIADKRHVILSKVGQLWLVKPAVESDEHVDRSGGLVTPGAKRTLCAVHAICSLSLGTG